MSTESPEESGTPRPHRGLRERLAARSLARFLGALALPLLACAKPGDEPGCAQLVEAERYEEAVMQCEKEFEMSGVPDAGAGAARSCYKLRRGECVLRWTERLRDTSAEADVLGMAGFIHWQRGEADRSLAAFTRQLGLYQAAGRHGRAARIAYTLYELHREAGRFREALEAAELALAEAQRADRAAMASAAYEALYNVFLQIGHLGAAERALEKKKALAPESGLSRAHLELGEGILHFYKHRPALAREAFLKALEIAGDGQAEAPRRELLRATHLNLVEVYLEMDDLDKAAEHLELAARYAEPDGRYPTALLAHRALLEIRRGQADAAIEALDEAGAGEPADDWAWALEDLRGMAEEARRDGDAAEAAYLRSIDFLESLRKELAFDELKAWLLEARRHPFEALFRLRTRQSRPLDALEVLESAKARTLLDAFVASTEAGEPDAVREGSPGAADVEDAARRAEALLELLPAVSRSPVVALRPVTEVVEKLADRHVLAYFETEDEIWLAAVARGQVEIRRLVDARLEAAELVDRFLARPGELSASEDLGRLLIPPDLLPPPSTPLYLVTDGDLGRLPFAALRVAGRFLVEDHDISYLPSLNAHVALLERSRSPGGPPIVLGDPRGDLPSAARELTEVAARLGVEPVTGGAANRAVLARAASAEWLHLATHTGLGPAGPWLLLADGELLADTIVRQRLGARRVMLAGCASGARRGRGLWGSLGAAFLVAGSESVVATLWSIDDAATRELVLNFYEEGGRADPAGGLARAQRAWIAAGRSPATWAAFVHLGTVVPSTPSKGEL